jgi:hypothetical protein
MSGIQDAAVTIAARCIPSPFADPRTTADEIP